MIPSSALVDQSTIATLLEHDPVVRDYRAFFSVFDWTCVEHWQARHSSRGRPAHPEAAYLKAFLIRIREGLLYTSQLRRFLLKHPLLVIELGFHLVPDPRALYGFDCQQTLPSEQWLREKLRSFDSELLQTLLQATVRAFQAEIPGLGEVVAFDVKHIYAWVKENNERVSVPDRYDKHQQPAGDADCKLGVKRSTNQEQADGSTKVKKELLWGYGSGVAAATTPFYGDVVLAEYTQPFNENDVTYFVPLYQHGHPAFHREPDGVPLCPKGLRMHPTYPFAHPNGYRAQLYRCPLVFPELQEGARCDHQKFQVAKGCIKHINIEAGGLMRIQLDRSGPLYQAVYTQRTSCERINSQAKELGSNGRDCWKQAGALGPHDQ